MVCGAGGVVLNLLVTMAADRPFLDRGLAVQAAIMRVLE